MQIIKVKYERLVSNASDCSNQTYGAEALVEDGETPEDARTNLIYWVDDMLRKRGELKEEESEINNNIYTLMNRQKTLQVQIEDLRNKKEKMVKFLAHHGVDTDKINRNWEDEIPF